MQKSTSQKTTASSIERGRINTKSSNECASDADVRVSNAISLIVKSSAAVWVQFAAMYEVKISRYNLDAIGLCRLDQSAII